MTPATYSHGTFTTTASTLSAGAFSPPSPSSARTSSAVNGTSFSVGRRTRAAITPCPDRSPSAPDRSSATGDDCLSYRDRQTEENRVPRFFFHEHDDDGDENDNDESHHSHNHNHNRNGSQRNPRHHNSHTGCDRSDTSGTSHHSHGDTPKIERLREKKRDLERRATAIRLSSPRYSRLGREDDEEFETCPVTARREVGTRHDEVWTPGRRRRRRGSADGAEGGDVRRGRSRSQSASARNRLREIHRFGLANGLGHGHEHEQGHGSGRSGDSPVSITTSNGNSSPALAKLRELKRNLEGRRPQRHPLHIFTEGVDRERKTHDNRLTPSSPRQAVPVIPTLPSTPATPKIVVDPLEKEDELLDSDLQTQQQQHQYTQPQSQPRPRPRQSPSPIQPPPHPRPNYLPPGFSLLPPRNFISNKPRLVCHDRDGGSNIHGKIFGCVECHWLGGQCGNFDIFYFGIHPSSLHRGKIEEVLRLFRNPFPHTHPHLFHIRRFPIDLGLVDHSHFGDDRHGGLGGVPLF
mmetsp:Transcript_23862/g.50708  ORF Transcript_23862/g.50708 Transcript_23862/m.50708 type:complete len:520 (+) Transcript_23862:349-1908(+)